MTVAGSSRSAPRTEIERIVPVTGGRATWTGACWEAAPATAVSWAKTGAAKPPRIVPTMSIAPVRLPIDLVLLEITRPRLLLNE